MSPIDKEILMRVRALLLQANDADSILKLLVLKDEAGNIRQPDQFTQANIPAEDFSVIGVE